MKKFQNIEQIWKTLDAGKTIYWASDAYQLTVEDSNLEWRQNLGFEIPFSNRDGKCLRVTCVSNWFGSILTEEDISKLYVK